MPPGPAPGENYFTPTPDPLGIPYAPGYTLFTLGVHYPPRYMLPPDTLSPFVYLTLERN